MTAGPGAAVQGRLLELAVPPLELAGDVALAAGEVAEPDGVDVDGVEPRPGCRPVTPTGVGPDRLGHLRRRLLVAQDVSVHERHHDRRGAVDGGVGAQAERPGDGHVRVDCRALMTVCSRVMSWAVASTWLTGGRRRAYGVAGGVGHPVGEVGAPAGDELEVVTGRSTPATLAASHVGDGARSMPSTVGWAAVVGCRSVLHPCPRRYPRHRSRPARWAAAGHGPVIVGRP